jgi:outer membrane immunogenic protein
MAKGGYDPSTPGAFDGFGTDKTYAAGVIGGGQLGYNWQIANTVWGIEGSISGLTGKAGSGHTFDSGKGNTLESQVTWLATLRGRAGWLMDPSTLLYATGGAAWGHVKNAFNPNGLGTTVDPAFTNKSVSKTKSGWVVGGGIEHKFLTNWTLGLEVLSVDLGKSTGVAQSGTKTSEFKNSVAIGQFKLNYKF